ncbi:hypothetical protein WJW69_004132 [Salmonella enterica]
MNKINVLLVSVFLLSGCANLYQNSQQQTRALTQSEAMMGSDMAVIRCSIGTPMNDNGVNIIDINGYCPQEINRRLTNGDLTQQSYQLYLQTAQSQLNNYREQIQQNNVNNQIQQQELNNDLDSLNYLNRRAISCGLHPRLCAHGY